MRFIYFTLFCFLSFSICFSQTSKTIKLQGVIKDKETQQPLPFASIVLIGSNFGTASNEEGKFILGFDREDYEKPTLRISSIGFKSQAFSVDSILKVSDSDVVFHLQADAIFLEEVEISSKGLSGKVLIEEALNAIGSNTLSKPFTLDYYSTIEIEDSVKVIYTEENIFQDYNQGGYHTAFYLEQRKSGLSPFAKEKCGLPAYFDILQMDILASPYRNGIVDVKSLPEFEIKYQGIITYEGDSVYVISYNAPKPNKKITSLSTVPRNYFYSGKLYIDINSKAIVRHSLQQGTKGFPLSQEILYRKINGFYFPYYIQSERIVNADKKKGLKLKNVLILRDAAIETKRPAKGFDNCNPPRFNKEFWSNFQ